MRDNQHWSSRPSVLKKWYKVSELVQLLFTWYSQFRRFFWKQVTNTTKQNINGDYALTTTAVAWHTRDLLQGGLWVWNIVDTWYLSTSSLVFWVAVVCWIPESCCMYLLVELLVLCALLYCCHSEVFSLSRRQAVWILRRLSMCMCVCWGEWLLLLTELLNMFWLCISLCVKLSTFK